MYVKLLVALLVLAGTTFGEISPAAGQETKPDAPPPNDEPLSENEDRRTNAGEETTSDAPTAEQPADDEPGGDTPTAAGPTQSDAAAVQRKILELETRMETVELQNQEAGETIKALKAKDAIDEATRSQKLSFPSFGDKDGVWGKLNIGYRARPEFRGNKDFNSDIDDSFFKVGQRARIGLGINYKHLLKTFVQIQDTRTFGHDNNTVSPASQGGTTDLHQAFAEIWMVKDVLALKVGRQQLVYGDQRLIGHLEWFDQGRVFDAAVLKWDYGVGQVEFFEAVMSPATNGNLIDGVTHFFGAYDSLKFVKGLILLDFYVLGLIDGDGARKPGLSFDDDPEEPADDATPEEVADYDVALAANQIHRKEVTLGTRFRIDHKIAKAGFELAGQLGKADAENDILRIAMAFHVDAGVVLPAAIKPKLSVEFNYASGDKDAADDREGRFNNLFPTNHMHYGFMDLASWSNTLNFAFRTGLAPTKFMKIGLDYWLLAKATSEDTWYNAGGVGQTATTDPNAQLLGHELDLTVKFLIAKPLKIITGASVFFPTATLSDPDDAAVSRSGDPQSWAYVMLVAGF